MWNVTADCSHNILATCLGMGQMYQHLRYQPRQTLSKVHRNIKSREGGETPIFSCTALYGSV